jgi:KDO2-lipid IV(A) lauroyltransferase
MAYLNAIQGLLDLGVRGLGTVPYSAGPASSRLLGRAGYLAYRSERRLALWNLEHCFPRASSAWHHQTALAFFEHLVTSAYEVFRAVRRPAEMEGRFVVEHGDRLEEAIARGKGVIAVSGHFGNFALLPFVLRTASPEPAFIARASKREVGPLVTAARAYYRESLKPMAGMRVLPSSLAGVREAAQLLRQGDLLVVFADLTWGMGELPVRFLGVDHRVSRAPASLALRTGAVLLPVVTVRQPDGNHRLIVEQPIPPPGRDVPGRDAERTMTERFAALLDGYVCERPEQWYWLHRSWRPAYPSVLR